MSQVIVVNNSLKIANNLCDILEQRDITVIKAGAGSSKPDFFGIDLVGYQADTLVCSNIFEKEIGGSSKLVSIARQAKLTKIIIISDDRKCNGVEIKDELGGALKRINVADIKDKYSLTFASSCIGKLVLVPSVSKDKKNFIAKGITK